MDFPWDQFPWILIQSWACRRTFTERGTCGAKDTKLSVLGRCAILDPIGSYWILLDPIGSYWILLDPIGSYWILLDPIGSYWILLDPIGSYWILLDPIGSYWILLGGFSWGKPLFIKQPVGNGHPWHYQQSCSTHGWQDMGSEHEWTMSWDACLQEDHDQRILGANDWNWNLLIQVYRFGRAIPRIPTKITKETGNQKEFRRPDQHNRITATMTMTMMTITWSHDHMITWSHDHMITWSHDDDDDDDNDWSNATNMREMKKTQRPTDEWFQDNKLINLTPTSESNHCSGAKVGYRKRCHKKTHVFSMWSLVTPCHPRAPENAC